MEARRQVEGERSPLVVPDAVLVRRRDAERVVPGRQVREIRDAPGARLHPAVLEALQPIPERDGGGIAEAESGVMELEVRVARGEAQAGDWIVRAVVRDHALDVHGRRQGVAL